MNKLFIVANWKMNGSKSSNEQLMEYINKHVYESANLEIVICPPYIYLDQIIKLKVPAIPKVPNFFLLYSPKWLCAQSSITNKL